MFSFVIKSAKKGKADWLIIKYDKSACINTLSFNGDKRWSCYHYVVGLFQWPPGDEL